MRQGSRWDPGNDERASRDLEFDLHLDDEAAARELATELIRRQVAETEAGGIGVEGSVGPGVAPGASLYALKVFGDLGGSTDVTSLAIE
jgi:hypothetical protein